MDFFGFQPPHPFGALCLSLFTGYIFDQVLAQKELKVGERENQALLLQALGFLASLWIQFIILIVLLHNLSKTKSTTP